MTTRTFSYASLAGVLALALMASLPVAAPASSAPASPAPARTDAEQAAYVARLKRLQQHLLMKGASRRIEQARKLHRLRNAGLMSPKGIGRGQPRDRGEGGGAQGGPAGPRIGDGLPPAALQALGANVRANNPAGDAANAGQAEQSIAVDGNNVLVAWNDGQGFVSGGDTQGYGYSTDGGASFTDGGVPPKPAAYPSFEWTSDPIVTVNEKTHEFWFCAMASPTATTNGVAVVKATFPGGVFTWGTPVVVRNFSNLSAFLDKPWFVADSVSGRLYLSYTVFGTADTIVFQRSAVGGATWPDNPIKLSANGDAGYVQGSRPVVGPNGEVYVTWYTIGQTASGLDYFHIRRSLDSGASFGGQATVASVYSNFGTGAPGFNRENGITFPSIAVDRSTGVYRGRVYVAWNECIDFYDDDLGTLPTVNESEANDTPATADPITIGARARGAVSTSSDFDYFSFSATAGQTVIVYADSVAGSLDMSLRLFCTDGTTRLAFSAPGPGLNNLLVFTIPVTGTYYIRCASFSSTTGSYKLATGFDVPTPGVRSRDHRDGFVAYSSDGLIWSTPVLAGTSPANYDDWLPEVAVLTNGPTGFIPGRVFFLWYDWRDSPAGNCGGLSHVYLTRSDDGGASWSSLGAVTDVQTNWTSVSSNIAPNQGDYLGLFANGAGVYAAWADGRNLNPDVYTSSLSAPTPTQVALASAQATPDHVTLTWFAGARQGFSATVERAETEGAWTARGTVSADGTGMLTWTDTAVTPGARYAYRLAWDEGGTTRATPATWVEVPAAPRFALAGARPNPATGGALHVSFSLPSAAPATLELLDVSGRRLREQEVGAAGSQVVNLGAGLRLEPGLYLVRLTQEGRTLTARVTVVR